MVLFFAFVAAAETTNSLSDAETQGRQLAQQLRELRPETNFSQAGVLVIRNSNGNRSNLSIKFEGVVYPTEWHYIGFPTNWYSIYQAFPTNGLNEELCITHLKNLSNKYYHRFGSGIGHEPEVGFSHAIWPGNMEEPFGHSDFWLCDLGLEFFHWPAQKILPKPTNLVRGRDYTLLESTNPNPSTDDYSRVLSWIDRESGGILQAEAYDFSGKLLKEFAPKSFKKVNGHWELQEMKIRNVQTGSSTLLEFDLNK